MTISEYMIKAHKTASANGFWDSPRNKAEMIALMHSELSECLEGLRNGDPPSDHIPHFSTVEEEMADVLIRIFDFCAGFHYDLEGALKAKIAFNETRSYKHGKAF